jgi:hypothetical protein
MNLTTKQRIEANREKLAFLKAGQLLTGTSLARNIGT